MHTYQLAYCTNVHPTNSADQLIENLGKYCGPVRQRGQDAEPSAGSTAGVGLWFSAEVLEQFRDAGRVSRLRSALSGWRLQPWTVNAFPQFNFHQTVVKHAVYQPDWTTADRLEYTLAVFGLLEQLLPPGIEASVSTLPLGWGRRGDASFQQECVQQLLAVARYLEQRERSTGRLMYLCLEPEPGCTLTTADDVVRFFTDRLRSSGSPDLINRYVRVCHDVCHAAVMFEPQHEVVQKYVSAGIRIGKVQISSAIELDWPADSLSDRQERLAALSRFDEPRYLHQTVCRAESGELTFWEDLNIARQQLETSGRGTVRVHFHLPIFVSSLGVLGTTQHDILKLLDSLAMIPEEQRPRHLEVETYAWDVLPDEYQGPILVDGIAHEMRWLSDRLAEQTSSPSKY